MPSAHVPAWAAQRFTPSVVACLGLLFCVSQACIGLILGPKLGQDVGQMQTFALVQPSVFRELAASWSQDDIDRFRRHFYLDFVLHPLIYSCFFAAWTGLELASLTSATIPLHYETWVGLIFMAGACDVIENAIHFSMLPNLDSAGDAEIRAAAVFSMIKWLIMLPTAAWCAAALVARLRRPHVD
jgi:hypothetical protein